jgi:hypothetical protein
MGGPCQKSKNREIAVVYLLELESQVLTKDWMTMQ